MVVAGALSELRGDLGRDPSAIRRRVAELTRDAVGAPIGAWYVFGLVDGEPYPADWASPDGLDVMFLKWRAERHPWPGGDPRAPSSKDIDRFVTTRSAFAPGELEQSPLHQRCVAPLGVIDQVRMMLYSKGRHIGWIGAMRAGGDEPFGERDLRRLRALTPAISAALVQADALERAASPEEACDLIVDPGGRVELASKSAADFLRGPHRREMIGRWIRCAERRVEPPAAIAGWRVHGSRMSGPAGSRYLLHVERIAPVRLSPTFELSRTQRRVAEYAAAGARVREIAEALSVAPTTVRTHLRAVYEVLGIGSRAELATALARSPLAGKASPAVRATSSTKSSPQR